jgi:hypothetical protein
MWAGNTGNKICPEWLNNFKWTQAHSPNYAYFSIMFWRSNKHKRNVGIKSNTHLFGQELVFGENL